MVANKSKASKRRTQPRPIHHLPNLSSSASAGTMFLGPFESRLCQPAAHWPQSAHRLHTAEQNPNPSMLFLQQVVSHPSEIISCPHFGDGSQLLVPSDNITEAGLKSFLIMSKQRPWHTGILDMTEWEKRSPIPRGAFLFALLRKILW